MFSFIRSDIAQLNAYTPHPLSGGTDIIPVMLDRLDANESPFDLPGELKQKLAWTYQQLVETNRYPDGGQETLKQAIAEYVNESAALYDSPPLATEGDRWGCTSANISVGNGSDELIRSILIATCLGSEGAILVFDPTFSMYGILAKTLGIPVVTVGRRKANFEIDLAAAADAIKQTQNPPVRVVFAVHPNSPTANALTDEELEWLRSLPEHILVVIDEAYFEFSQTSVVAYLERHPNWVVLRTFSKAFRLAAHRVGYAIAHLELTAALEKIRLPYNLPSFSQAAALVSLAHRQQLLAAIPQILSEKDKLINALSRHPVLQVWPSAANFIYLRLLEPTCSQTDDRHNQLVQQLRAAGTLVRHTGGGIRITVGTPDENLRTLDRLQTILSESVEC